MKNRKLVCSFILSIFIVGCAAPPVASAVEPAATQELAAPAADVPAVGAPTTTTIPLPQPAPQATLILAATVPVPLISGSGLPLASPNGVSLNCRGGPDVRWPVGDVLDPGEIVQVVGRNPDSTWWYVSDPAAPLGFCWISAAFATITGDVSAVPIEVVSAVPLINGTPVGTITEVRIVLEPDTINIPGCAGPSPSIKIAAKIWVDGPVDFRFHFEGDDIPNLKDHHFGFSGPDIDDVTDSFAPPLNAGKHVVFMVVDEFDISGVGAVATYKIIC